MKKMSQNKFTAEEKVKIINEGEYGSMSINEVCRRHQISPNSYYLWRSRESRGDLEDQYHVPVNLNAPLASEIAAVIDYALEHPKEGYRRLCWMMVDEDIAFLSASSIYRILADRDLLCRWKKSGKSGGKYDFKPTAPHQQWHTDLMYLWVSGRWYFFIGVLDARLVPCVRLSRRP